MGGWRDWASHSRRVGVDSEQAQVLQAGNTAQEETWGPGVAPGLQGEGVTGIQADGRGGKQNNDTGNIVACLPCARYFIVCSLLWAALCLPAKNSYVDILTPLSQNGIVPRDRSLKR